jgi:hypothetical protein
MRLSLLSLTAAAGTAAAVLAAPHTARAADAVYGGSAQEDPIVVKADAKASKLKSIVVSWRAGCGDGSDFPASGELTPIKVVPGFSPGADELLMSRNAAHRFKGTQFATYGGDTWGAVVQVTVDGKFARKRASGRLAAVVKILDPVTSNEVTSCQITRRWVATRSAGIIYGGTTSQDAPFVMRLNSRRNRIANVMTTWHAPCSQGSFTVPDRFGDFPLKRSGAFGNPFTFDTTMDAGEKLHFDYSFGGRVATKKAGGTLQVKIAQTDPAGAPLDSCDTGAVTWKATTG